MQRARCQAQLLGSLTKSMARSPSFQWLLLPSGRCARLSNGPEDDPKLFSTRRAWALFVAVISEIMQAGVHKSVIPSMDSFYSWSYIRVNRHLVYVVPSSVFGDGVVTTKA